MALWKEVILDLVVGLSGRERLFNTFLGAPTGSPDVFVFP